MPTLSDIAALIGCPTPPDGGRPVTGIAALTDATADQLSFVTSEAFAEQYGKTRAGGVIAIDRNGRFAMPFNTPGMYRGHVGAEGQPVTLIYGHEQARPSAA